MSKQALDMLFAARRIADYAKDEGVLLKNEPSRVICEHLGAALADSVLQAGLNYRTVVFPRVRRILQTYPNCQTVSSLIPLIESGNANIFLDWGHHEKILRFEALVFFLHKLDIDDVLDLRSHLICSRFRENIQTLNGIGPKTVDYMACLIGIDSIAVDRHVRTFAKAAGVTDDGYHFLKESFCYAADLLSISRREFDSWLWRRAATSVQTQLSLAI